MDLDAFCATLRAKRHAGGRARLSIIERRIWALLATLDGESLGPPETADLAAARRWLGIAASAPRTEQLRVLAELLAELDPDAPAG